MKKSKKTVIPYRNDCFSSAKQNIVANYESLVTFAA